MDELETAMSMMKPIESDDVRSEVKKVEAIKLGFKQAREGNVVTFRLHFDDDTRFIADMPLGARVMLAVAEIVE
jgi:hypothetical protein